MSAAASSGLEERRWGADEELAPALASALRRLLVDCFGKPADEPPATCDWRWLVLEGGAPVAHVAVRRMRPPAGEIGHLAYAATAPSCRRRGLASLLLGRVQEQAPSLGLTSIVLQAEPAALGLYLRLGWQPIAPRARFLLAGREDGDPVLAWSRDPARLAALRSSCFAFDDDW